MGIDGHGFSLDYHIPVNQMMNKPVMVMEQYSAQGRKVREAQYSEALYKIWASQLPNARIEVKEWKPEVKPCKN